VVQKENNGFVTETVVTILYKVNFLNHLCKINVPLNSPGCHKGTMTLSYNNRITKKNNRVFVPACRTVSDEAASA